jgi:hypothetical protein
MNNINNLNDMFDKTKLSIISTLSTKNSLYELNIYSICLKFTALINDKKINDKLYLKFKYLPFFYLLNYQTFKVFLSEIIYYDNKKNKFSFNKTKFEHILNKYVKYIKSNLNDINSDLKDITFYKNEVNFPFVYKWFVYIIDNLQNDNTLIKNDDDNNQEKNETKNMIYELKIVLPKIKFKILKYETIIKNNLKKNLMIQLMKTNFLKWEELIMLELFFIKKFRIIINSILNNNKYCKQKISLISNHDFKNKNYLNKNKNLEFYISKTNNNCSYYYIFNPYTIILNNRKNKYHQEIHLS